MTISTGVAKRLKYKVESTWGTVPVAASSQALRRVSSTLALEKEGYGSQEILSSYQEQDFRHGMRSVKGTISGELSPGTYKDFMAAAVRRAFGAVTAVTGMSITIATGSILGGVQTYTVTRSAGSWISDGIKLGHVGRLSAGSFNAANLLKNMFVLAETATVLTVIPLNGVALVAEGPIASSTWTTIGKTTYVPTTAHTDLSYSIEHWHADTSLSEVFTGCKIEQMSLSLPPSGMATVNFDFLGKDVTTAGAEYFTSPTAETTAGILAAVNGALMVSGTPVGLLTGLSFGVKGNMSGEAVVGSNVFADITEGRVEADGQFTVLLSDATFRDYFLNETEVGLYAAFAASPSGVAEFVAFGFPRIKINSATRNDGEKALTLTCSFKALRNSSGGAATTSEDTTVAIQDSLA